MTACLKCYGAGVILLFTSSKPCDACGGTGEVKSETTLADTLSQGNTAQGSDLWIKDAPPVTGAGSGGDIFITTGSTTGTGSSGNITISGGESYTPPPEAFSFKSPGGAPSISMLTGTGNPSAEGIHASTGSLYLRDDGIEGSVWIKTGEGAGQWSQLATEQLTTTIRGQALPPYRETSDLLEWAVATFAQSEKDFAIGQETGEHPDTPGILVNSWIPCIAPVGTPVLADAMALLEQEGHEVEAFVSSSRDFADIRKFAIGGHVVLNGKELSVFGVPFLHSHKIPVGYMGAVSTERLMAALTITR